MMDASEIALRKRAVQLFLSGEPKSEIARELGRSRVWVYRWTDRYQPDHPEESLQDQDRRPKHPHREWSEETRQQVLNSRQLRQEAQLPGYRYALIGAEAIFYELCELGISPVPPVRTIHFWLKQADLIPGASSISPEEHPPKPYPAPRCEAVNDVQELDLKGPFYLTGSSQKYYLCALRDIYSKQVALQVLVGREMGMIMDFLLSAWQKLGLPRVLQMDNGLEFRGSNRYPRSFGKLVWLCLDLEIEPLFIPPHEPWRNGVIENLNGQIDDLFLKRETFRDETQLLVGAAELEMAINSTHRLPALYGKTPLEFVQQAKIRPLPQGYAWRERNLRLVKGKVSFVRLVRQSGRITLCAQDKFEIGQEYQWQYVLATVEVAAHRLDIFLNGQPIKSFDYR
jgi:transposase